MDLFQRGGDNPSGQEVPDERLQLAMLRDVLDNRDNPGTIVLLTGDGRGYDEGRGFFRTIEDIYSLDMGWDIELLSWEHTCHQRMKDWVQEHGTFVPLDDYYESVTFLKRNDDDPYNLKLRDRASIPDLSARPLR